MNLTRRKLFGWMAALVAAPGFSGARADHSADHSKAFCPPFTRDFGTVPPAHLYHLKWHILRGIYPNAVFYERSEFVPDNGSGHPIWIRWERRTGDFASLCQAEYVGAAVDQDSPAFDFPLLGMVLNGDNMLNVIRRAIRS